VRGAWDCPGLWGGSCGRAAGTCDAKLLAVFLDATLACWRKNALKQKMILEIALRDKRECYRRLTSPAQDCGKEKRSEV
jgi:hypothetical protein